MSRSYYVIELTARWLTVLLVALALLMVVAFCLGYGAAFSVHSGSSAPAIESSPSPVVMTEIELEPTAPEPQLSAATPVARSTATPRPTDKPGTEFWVQVLASSKDTSIAAARTKLVGLGFDRDHQKVVRSKVAGGNELIKLRVGPFPTRASADRVLQRMQSADFPDAWVVVP